MASDTKIAALIWLPAGHTCRVGAVQSKWQPLCSKRVIDHTLEPHFRGIPKIERSSRSERRTGGS